MLNKATNPEIVRTASMPAPSVPASVEAIQAFEDRPPVEAAISASDRALHIGLGRCSPGSSRPRACGVG